MKRPIDLSLYLVTTRNRGFTDFFQIIRQAIAGGVTVVQLREKDASDDEVIELGKALQSLLKPLAIPLIINDRVEIAHRLRADGVHLGQSDLKASEARAMLGKDAIIGLSVETLDQAKAAQQEDVDYLAASPVFPTRTKTDCSKPWGLQDLKTLCSISRFPVVAIGGITESNVQTVLACGVNGVAIVSPIFNALCPETAARTLIQKMRDKHEY